MIPPKFITQHPYYKIHSNSANSILYKEKTENQKYEKPVDVLFLSDIDGTWLANSKKTPDSKKIKDILNENVQKLIKDAKEKNINLMLAYITGRPSSRLMEVGLPKPDFSIVQNGGEIYKGYPKDKTQNMPEWVKLNKETHFDAKILEKAIKELSDNPKFKNLKVVGVGDVVHNPEASACDYMKTICIKNNSIKRTLGEKYNKTPFHETKQVCKYVLALQRTLQDNGMVKGKNYIMAAPSSFTSAPYVEINISSPKSQKEEAIKFLMKHINQNGGNIKNKNTIIACNGQNDITMCTDRTSGNGYGDGRRLIIVGDNVKLRQKASALFNNDIIMRPASEPSSLGVLIGLKEHLNNIWNKIQKKQDKTASNPPAFKGNKI